MATTVTKKSVSEIIDDEYKLFSMYTIENRAIPSAIDGLKPVMRKLLYAMLKENSNKQVKVVDAASISKYGYHHGEVAAAEAAIKMAQGWSNNVPIFQSHGNFGSRLVPEAAAPRYIHITMNKAFNEYFTDFDVCPKNIDVEYPEPQHYLPIIPWVLVNGIKGIAVGFATNILPRHPSHLVEQCSKYLTTGEVDNVIIPHYPCFNGTVEYLGENKYKTVGIINSEKRGYVIEELPIGYDRSKYITMLNDMIDNQKISDYQDLCSKQGFKFVIRVNKLQKEQIEKVGLLKSFDLETSFTENLTTLDINGKLKVFSSISELIKYFCDYRITKFDEKIAKDCDTCAQQIDFLTDKIKFIQAVIDNKIDFRQTSKKQLLEFIKTEITTDEYGSKFISIPLYECTTDLVDKLSKDIVQLKKQLVTLSKTTAKKLFLTNLEKAPKCQIQITAQSNETLNPPDQTSQRRSKKSPMTQ